MVTEAEIRRRLDALTDREHENIDELGFCSRGVGADDGDPSFTYSMGFYRSGCPDVLIWGLPPRVSHQILWNIYKTRVETGEGLSDGTYVSEGANFPLALRKLSSAYVSRGVVNGVVYHAYRDKLDHFPEVLVAVWPDERGVFPWQPGFDEKFRNFQPEESWAESAKMEGEDALH